MPNHILETDQHSFTNATINSVRARWLYVNGFKRAADVLADEVLRTLRGQDYLVYPIMFNYRHFMELAIKDILYLLADVQGDTNKAERHHSLKGLWSLAFGQLHERWSLDSTSDQYLSPIDDMVKFFHDNDPASTAFRYSEVPLGISNINIETVREKMEEVACRLDSIQMSLKCELDALSEYYTGVIGSLYV